MSGGPPARDIYISALEVRGWLPDVATTLKTTHLTSPSLQPFAIATGANGVCGCSGALLCGWYVQWPPWVAACW